EARVRVEFPKGVISEWYPQADSHIDWQDPRDGAVQHFGVSGLHVDPSMRSVTGVIDWKNIKIEPNTAPNLPRESSPSRYYAARETDGAPVTAGNQHEKFLFYRGIARFDVPLSARLLEDGKVALANRGSEAMPEVWLFENREGRIGYRRAGTLSG